MAKKEKPVADSETGKIKVKAKMKKPAKDLSKETVTKVDLSKPIEPKTNETKEETTENNTNDGGVVELVENANAAQEQEKIQSESKTQEAPVLEEITEDPSKSKVEEKIKQHIENITSEAKTVEKSLPEDVQKLVDFMKETGGDLNDYVRLNQDYSKLDDKSLLHEYYRQTKPHLTSEEINFLMEDSFYYDEEIDEERDIKRKKLALKEQVASAKSHLDGQKSKYYKDIKAGSKLTQKQQKAIDFFNRYNKETEENQKIAKTNSEIFTQKTDKVFNDDFKGFEYNVGEKRYRFNVSNAEEIKTTQSDINNFTKKFLDKKMALKDAAGYHKSLYTAMNADAVARHFYEQGKADAIKDSVAKAKNVNMDPRQSDGTIEAGCIKVRVLGDNSSDFKFKIKNKNK